MDNTNNKNISTKLFSDRASVENAYQEVLANGHTEEDVNFIMNDDTRKKHFSGSDKSIEIGNKSIDGLAVGSATGGLIGGLAGAIAAIGTALVIPGLGLVVAGPLAAGLAGAGAGGIAGGLIGTLVGLGIPEEKVKEYEEGIKNGGILMAVKSKDVSSFESLNNKWK